MEHTIPDITNLATTVALSAKTNDIKGKVPDVTNLVATTANTTVENKMANASTFFKKKLTITQELVKLKLKLLLITIMMNKLLIKNLIS